MKMRLAAMALAAWASPAAAQMGSPWQDEPFWERPNQRYRSGDFYDNRAAPASRAEDVGGEALRNGGPRPEIAPQTPPVVTFLPDYAPGSIVIDSGGRKLYFVLPNRQAFQYPISVGREGFAWAGTEKISRKQAWPDWNPPEEMRKRDPKLPIRMTGGLKNPLGAMALYLGNTLYRIHGTNDEKTIGYASSSGCFRMMNSAVLHLAQFAQVGTTVTVVNRLPNAPPEPPVAMSRPARPGLPPAATARPRAQPPPEEPQTARRPLPPVEPPVARRPLPPLEPPPVARRPLPDEPPVASAGRSYRDDDDRGFDDYDRRRWPRERREPSRFDDRGVADVEVRPVDVDEYDPYVRRPVERRRIVRDRFAGRPYDRGRYPPPSYADDPDTRVWYDDERDDY